MANYNKVMLMGNLTRDPQLSYTPSQTAVVEFGLAVNRRWTGNDGSSKEETCFVDCQAFGRQAENINKYMAKGRPIFVEGRLKFESWTAQDGTKRSKHKVTVSNFQFLPDGRSAGQMSDDRRDTTDNGPQTTGNGNQTTQSRAAEDDIPF